MPCTGTLHLPQAVDADARNDTEPRCCCDMEMTSQNLRNKLVDCVHINFRSILCLVLTSVLQ